jgi:hypothetical protein
MPTLGSVFNKKMVKFVIYLLFSYQTGYIMWHSRLMIYIPWGAAEGNIDHKPGMYILLLTGVVRMDFFIALLHRERSLSCIEKFISSKTIQR